MSTLPPRIYTIETETSVRVECSECGAGASTTWPNPVPQESRDQALRKLAFSCSHVTMAGGVATAVDGPADTPPAPPLTDEEIADLRKMVSTAALPWQPTDTPNDRCCWDAHVETVARDNSFGDDRDGRLPNEDIADVNDTARAKFIADACNALPRLLDFAERTRKLLGEMEWTEYGDMGDPPECWKCNRTESQGHEPRCELAALLGRK